MKTAEEIAQKYEDNFGGTFSCGWYLDNVVQAMKEFAIQEIREALNSFIPDIIETKIEKYLKEINLL